MIATWLVSTDAWAGIIGVTMVSIATVALGSIGFRLSRTTSDFYVASRTVGPRLNAAAIGGEYLSAASFLGVAALVFTFGAQMLWYPIGWTAGYLVLLLFVAAPLRRSGAYTLPDFAEARLRSTRVRAVCSVLVVAVGWLYLLPQLYGASITLEATLGAPAWLGAVTVAGVVLVNVTSGGMRSITLVQAFQYWLKLTALLVPAAVLLIVWLGDGRPSTGLSDAAFTLPVADGGGVGLYTTYSLILAIFLGTMGLPHVVVRFYTNPNGSAARRTTLVVLVLLGIFYLLPPIYAVLGRAYGAESVDPADVLVLELPSLMLPGLGGSMLSGLLVAGAFAAFLSTSSGLVIAIAGVIAQDVTSKSSRISGVTAFRIAAVVAVIVPLAATVSAPSIGVARAVGLAFAVTASTFCPLLILGIWWRRLTVTGALAGLVVGGLGSGAAVVWALMDRTGTGWSGALVAQPAAWSVPAAFAAAVLASLVTQASVPTHADQFLARLHVPEAAGVEG